MNALLLAAGLGKRLLPITKLTPKCLVEINGTPLLKIWLEKLSESEEIENIYINTHYFPEKVEEFIKNLNDEIRGKIELIYEKELLGTAGTLQRVIRSANFNKPMLIAHADNLSFFSLDCFIEAYRTRPDNCDITMMTFEAQNPQSCGIVKVNSDNIVTAFMEKPSRPAGNLANGAVYVASPQGLREILGLSGATDISYDVLPKFICRINTWHNSIYHRDIGTPKSFNEAQIDWKNFY